MSKKKQNAFTEKKWHGKPMFQCGSCPWSTLDKEEMEKHIGKHAEAVKPRVVRHDTGLVGPAGGKIVREEEVTPEAPDEEDTHE